MSRPAAPAGSTGQIVCLGDVMIDIEALLPGPLAIGSDTPAPIHFSHGGSAANTAAWLASLGVPCVFAGRVGPDSFGQDAIAALRSHGVLPRVSIDPSEPTGVCVVLVAPDGERSMIPSAGANATLAEADLGADLLSAGDHLHVSGYSLLNEGCRPAARFALALAAELGVSISVDAASAAPIRQVGGERFLDWLAAGTMLLGNVDEVAALTGTSDEAAAIAALVERGLIVGLKCGSRGSVLGTAAESWSAPARPARVLDTTGAGDAFDAGFLAALWNGADLQTALIEGNRLGAVAVAQLGARPAPG